MNAACGCANKDDVQKEEKEDQKEYKLFYSFYFDGTLNNMYNTASLGVATEEFNKIRDNYSKYGYRKFVAAYKKMERVKKRGVSYTNALSNVAKLFRLHKKEDAKNPKEVNKILYLEGIGTRKGWKDIWFKDGAATGKGLPGNEGILDKCNLALSKLIGEIKAIAQKSDCESIKVTIDAFGFSRGAAAARHFVHLVDEKDFSQNKVAQKIYRFIGLFDTVSAYGLPSSHDNNVRDLHLNKIKLADFVVQYSAADEHRKNFSLTNISSAGNGKSYSLPGVHSDIGGGYNHNIEDTEHQIYDYDGILTAYQKKKIDNDKKWWIKTGYFKSHDFDKVNFWNELYVQRREVLLNDKGERSYHWRSGKPLYKPIKISNKYSKVALQLLRTDAIEIGGEYFSFLRMKYGIKDLTIKSVFQHLKSIKGNEIKKSYWKNKNYRLGSITLGNLRRKYCHISAIFGSIGMGPRFNSSNQRVRREYDDKTFTFKDSIVN